MSEIFNNGYKKGIIDNDSMKTDEAFSLNEQYLAGYSVARAEIACNKAGDSNSYAYFLGMFVGYYGIDCLLVAEHYNSEQQDLFNSGLIDGKDENSRENEVEYSE